MELRKIVLRVLLWSLGIGAAAGATAILLGSEQIIWRVLGTAMLTAGAAALMLPLTFTLDQPTLERPTWIAMGFLIAQYLFWLALIWQLVDAVTGSALEDDLALSALSLWPAVLAFTAALAGRRVEAMKWSSRTALALTLVMMGCFVAAPFVTGRWGERTLGSGWVVGAYGLTAVIALIGVGGTRSWIVAALGCLGAAVGSGIVLASIWDLIDGNDPTIPVAATCLAVVIAHGNLMVRTPARAKAPWLVWITIAAMIATGIAFTAAVGPERGNTIRDQFARMAGAAGMIAGCGTLAILILCRFLRRPRQRPTSITTTVFDHLQGKCPQCHAEQSFALGETRCRQCGLIVAIKVAQPRCPQCDYPLIGIGNRPCPECGWTAASSE